MPHPTRDLRRSVFVGVTLLVGCYSSGNVLETRDAAMPADRDARTSDTGPTDGSTTVEPESCTRPELAFDYCGSCDDAARGWYWDGSRCVDGGPSRCPCVGSSCSSLQTYGTEAQCNAAHASCNANLCGATGGTWYEVSSCGFRCGAEVVPRPNQRCMPRPDCLCAPGMNFRPGIGCVADSQCTVGDLCLATGGFPTVCGVNHRCGTAPDDCASTWPEDGRSCTCGPRTQFDPTLGCVLDETCGSLPQQKRSLCEFSGGRWVGSYCGPTTCGVQSPLACATGGCECGPYEVFDEVRGCVLSPQCDPRPAGATCDERARCADGLACCGGVCVSNCLHTANPCGSGRCDPLTGCRA